MKKIIYISAFTFLGILLQLIVHAAVEVWYIGLLTGDFQKYSLGLSWNQWFLIHHIGTVILLFAGGLFGFWLARLNFQIEQRRRRQKSFGPLKAER